MLVLERTVKLTSATDSKVYVQINYYYYLSSLNFMFLQYRCVKIQFWQTKNWTDLTDSFSAHSTSTFFRVTTLLLSETLTVRWRSPNNRVVYVTQEVGAFVSVHGLLPSSSDPYRFLDASNVSILCPVYDLWLVPIYNVVLLDRVVRNGWFTHFWLWIFAELNYVKTRWTF